MIWYFAMPLTYFEAGLSCNPKALYSTLTDGYLLIFLILFMYILMPVFARISSCILTYVEVNIWLLKGMEVKTLIFFLLLLVKAFHFTHIFLFFRFFTVCHLLSVQVSF